MLDLAIAIPLVGGGHALIDAADEALVSGWTWRLRASPSGNRYAVARLRKGSTPQKLWMHRLIANPGLGLMVDHANGDGLDNRRRNLRVCTNAENQRNRRIATHPKGVTWERTRRKWRAAIKVNGRSRTIGRFASLVEAAAAYDAAAREAFGAFARTNAVTA